MSFFYLIASNSVPNFSPSGELILAEIYLAHSVLVKDLRHIPFIIKLTYLFPIMECLLGVV